MSESSFIFIFKSRTAPDLSSLGSLQINNCSSFVSLPEEGLPAPNLTWFRVDNCNNLKALPGQMHSLLPSLQTLSTHLCPELELFPDRGLPSSLNSLEIHSCDKLIVSRMGWGLKGLHSLRSFYISGKCENWESFPERRFLPSSLTSLEIWVLKHLKSLNGNELQHLTALRKSAIGHCQTLQSMPEKGLPTSLSSLIMKNCPMLKERCLMEKGEDWHKIEHIPLIKIDKEVISSNWSSAQNPQILILRIISYFLSGLANSFLTLHILTDFGEK
uniref:Uncharacterized protein n=1 Tax=Quercus lobata TaxID=97700 RepID=A0A7N2LDN5_QUELO